MRHFLLFITAAATLANAFILPQGSQLSPALRPKTSAGLNLAKNRPEYHVVDEGDRENDSSDYTVVDTKEDTVLASSSQHKQFEYAAFLPGAATTLHIQVGDLALARKAWKKRRRSGSPLLVPCSVLDLDRISMLRENMVFLLYKFGTAQKDGVVLSAGDLNQRFKSHLKGKLSVRKPILFCCSLCS